MRARPKGGKGADWNKGPKQERKRVKWAGKQARDPEAVHKTRQEKTKDNCMQERNWTRMIMGGRDRQGIWSLTRSLEGRRNCK